MGTGVTVGVPEGLEVKRGILKGTHFQILGTCS